MDDFPESADGQKSLGHKIAGYKALVFCGGSPTTEENERSLYEKLMEARTQKRLYAFILDLLETSPASCLALRHLSFSSKEIELFSQKLAPFASNSVAIESFLSSLYEKQKRNILMPKVGKWGPNIELEKSFPKLPEIPRAALLYSDSEGESFQPRQIPLPDPLDQVDEEELLANKENPAPISPSLVESDAEEAKYHPKLPSLLHQEVEDSSLLASSRLPSDLGDDTQADEETILADEETILADNPLKKKRKRRKAVRKLSDDDDSATSPTKLPYGFRESTIEKTSPLKKSDLGPSKSTRKKRRKRGDIRKTHRE
jgi:hypothetical protein